MVEMTGEERKVAKLLIEKKFKFEFQPSVSVKDMGGRTRLFNPDFYLTDLGIYIEVCGAERTEHYERTREIYKKNNVPIIYVETYKDESKWKHYLLQRIKEIQEKRQSAVSTINPPQPKVEEGTKKPNYEKISAEITSHIKEIETHKISNKPKPNFKQKNAQSAPSKKEYFKFNAVSKQSQVGIMLILLGVLFIIITIIIFSYNLVIGLIMGIVGLFMFYLGFHIISYRFSRWFRNWLKITREKFRTWLQK